MKGGESKDEDLTDADIYPCFVDGKETFIVQSYIGPDGESIYTPNWGQQKVWLYRVESGSEERKLIYDKPVPYVDRSNFNMIAGDSVFFADYEPNTTGGSSPKTFHLVNLSTGEDKILAENITDVKLYRLAFTDRCLMWLRDDPTEQYSYILYCYDYLTGEEKEYPLKGDKKRKWREGELFYDRGLLYLVGPNLFDEKGAIYSHTALVVWDIASGAQREIYKGEIVAEVK